MDEWVEKDLTKLYLILKINIFIQVTNSRASIRVNLPRGGDVSYLSRAKVKTTNLSLTVVTIFIITNLPYMVDEFIRQDILADSWCTLSWCGAVEVIKTVSRINFIIPFYS